MNTRAENYAESSNSYFRPLTPQNEGLYVKFNCKVQVLQISNDISLPIYVILEETCLIREMITIKSTRHVDRGLLRIMESASPDIYSLTLEDGTVTDDPRSINVITMQLITLYLQLYTAISEVRQQEKERNLRE